MLERKLMQRFPSSVYLEERAARRLPRFVFDYLQGGSGRQSGVQRNRRVFDQVDLVPRYFDECGSVDLSTELMGQSYRLPFGIAPIGMDGLIWPGAVRYLAQAARQQGCPVAASTFATASLEEVAQLAPGVAWFQLYPFSDRAIETDLIDRARRSGYEVLVVTVDVPVGGRRELDIRNGLALPPRFGPRTVMELMSCPQWALASARQGIPCFRNLQPYRRRSNDYLPARIEGAVPWSRLAHYRRLWPGKLVVKGVLRAEDALRCRDMGLDGILVSNHGGRQLDACPAPLRVLPSIRRAVGADFPIIVDSGLRSGLDVARAIAMGADFALLGRTFMYGIAALGEAGADHVIRLLKEEVENTMQMIRCPDIAALKQWNADPDGTVRR